MLCATPFRDHRKRPPERTISLCGRPERAGRPRSNCIVPVKTTPIEIMNKPTTKPKIKPKLKPTVATGTEGIVFPETTKGSDGIFYLVPFPEGWVVRPIRFDQCADPDFGHPGYWEEVVAEVLAKKWHSRVAKEYPTPNDLRAELLPLVYAFPRGRITGQGRKFIVYHGRNFEAFMKCERKVVESHFGIQGRCVWQFDEHEQCQELDKERVREVLRLRNDWKAV